MNPSQRMDNQATVAAIQALLPQLPGTILAAVRPPLYIDVDEVSIARELGGRFLNLKKEVIAAAAAEGERAHVLFSEPISDPALLQRITGWIEALLDQQEEGPLYVLGGVILFHNLLTDAQTEQTLDLMSILRPYKDRHRLLVMVPGVMINEQLLFMDRFAPFSSEGVQWIAGDLAATGRKI